MDSKVGLEQVKAVTVEQCKFDDLDGETPCKHGLHFSCYRCENDEMEGISDK